MTESDQQLLFAAYTRAYEREGTLRTTRFVVDVVLGVVGIGLALFDVEIPLLAAGALAWLVVRELPFFNQPDAHRRRAVKIQEEFDCTYPGIEWNHALNGEREQPHKIRELAAECSAVLDDNYWVDTTDLPDRVGALLRQGQSALWGQEGHERYWRVNAGAVALATFLLLGLAWWLELSVEETIVSVFAPVAPLIVGRVQAARRHREESSERKSMANTVETELELASPERLPSENFVQSMQGRLYRSRLTGGRIPQWLYDRYKGRDQASIDSWLVQLASRLRQRFSTGSPSH